MTTSEVKPGRPDEVLPARRERIPVKAVLIVGTLSLFGPLCIDLYLPALPAVGIDLQTSASRVQLSLTACFLGLAVGQVVVGSLSDRFGRRRPLFFGLSAFVLASAACAAAPGIWTLIALRFIEGLGGAAGLVLSRAIVRDMYSGATAARFYSLQMVIVGAGPMLAPSLGAGLLHFGSWRLLFLALALAGTVLTAIAALQLPETLAVEDRRTGGLLESLRTMHTVATKRTFIVNAASNSFALGGIYAYVAGSAFVLENIYGVSPQTFSALYGLNAVGLIGASAVNSRLVGRIGASRLLVAGLVGLASAGLLLFTLVALDAATLVPVLFCMFMTLTSFGFIGGNATALALNDLPESAGSASALLGVLQFTVGSATAPLVGLGGTHDLKPLALVMALCGLIALGTRLSFRSADRAGSVVREVPSGTAIADLAGVAPEAF